MDAFPETGVAEAGCADHFSPPLREKLIRDSVPFTSRWILALCRNSSSAALRAAIRMHQGPSPKIAAETG